MARLVLVLAVIAISTSAPLVRLAAPAPALTVAALRIAAASLLLLAIAPGALRAFARLSARERGWVVVAGLLLGVHFGVWITSLYFTSVASSVTLVATQPIFAAVLGRVFLGDAVGRRAVIGIAIATAGTAVLAGGDVSVSGRALIGDGLALLGAAAAAAYLVVGRRMRVAMPLFPYLALVNLVAGAALLVTAIVFGAQIVGFDADVYLAIGGCAVFPSLVGHTLLNYSVRRIPTHLVALAVLGEPVGATLLSWAVVGEVPPVVAAAGGAIILIGIGVGFGGKRHPET